MTVRKEQEIALGPFLRKSVELGEGAESDFGGASSLVNRVTVEGAGEWQVSGDFRDDGTDSVKLVLP